LIINKLCYLCRLGRMCALGEDLQIGGLSERVDLDVVVRVVYLCGGRRRRSCWADGGLSVSRVLAVRCLSIPRTDLAPTRRHLGANKGYASKTIYFTIQNNTLFSTTVVCMITYVGINSNM